MGNQAIATYKRLKSLGSSVTQAEMAALPAHCQSLSELAAAMLYNKEHLAYTCLNGSTRPGRAQEIWEELAYIFLGDGEVNHKLTRLPLAELLQLADSRLTF